MRGKFCTLLMYTVICCMISCVITTLLSPIFLSFSQSSSYTYFNSNCTSYIDHVFISKYVYDSLNACHIICDLPDNISDRYPLHTSIKLNVRPGTNADNELYDIPVFPRIDWSSADKCNIYHYNLCNSHLPMVDPDSISTIDEAQRVTGSICEQVTSTMQEACQQVNTAVQSRYKGRYKPNNWWNTNCLVTRDRQRFWYTIWRSCGRPRTGHVYDIYKAAKKAYRAACRQASNESIRRVILCFGALFVELSAKRS